MEQKKYSLQILNQFKNSKFSKLNTFHIFLPITSQKEINTWEFIDYLLDKNKYIIIPKVDNDFLKHYIYTTDTKVKINKWNIPEPVNALELKNLNLIDVVFIPLLISDKNGNRIGYGKGFYDKFLAKLPRKTLKIGINYFSSLEDSIEVEPHDIPLDYLISPLKIESFSANPIK